MDGQNLGPEDMQQLNQIEELKKQLMTKMLSKEAFERLGRVRAVNPELASQVELYLIQVYQTGKMQDKISDRKMKDILGLISQHKKRDFRIKRA
ncbi:MAG: DNA-binding protein [Candidatus Aenigmarchaeota archaeon]|nr:DNA-binding protein [Candidatus Aenigmarchaeota archaeon]